MKKALTHALALIAGIVLCLGEAQAKINFATIGTGGISGVYYTTGCAIAKIVNKKKKAYGIRATVESTGGSVFNVNAILGGDLDFGVVQSDVQFQAVKGQGDWADKGPQKDLCAVFSIHAESVTLVAAADAGINTIADLKGRRVNLGNPGSGQLVNSMDALRCAGLDPNKDVEAEKVKAAEAPALLQDGRIDAFFYTVGHPNGNVKEATSGPRTVKIVAINGPGLGAMLAKKPYYVRSTVAHQHYPGARNDGEVETFGVKATLCASAKTPDEVVYAVTREVFDNLEEFSSLHPAFAGLTREGLLTGLSAPIHPGAMKYYREVGLIK